MDSVNGSTIEPKNGKLNRCAVTSKPPYHAFWQEAIKTLESMHFISENNHKRIVIPSITNFINNLKCFQYLWKKLEAKGFKFLRLRNINQDPLENFYCLIRSEAGRNVNPSCTSFAASYRSLIINNFFAIHSSSCNCEEDKDDDVLNTLTSLLTSEEEGIMELIINNEEADGFQFSQDFNIL